MHYKFSDKEIRIDESSNTLTNIRPASFKNNTCFIGNWVDISEETEAKRLKIKVNTLSSPSCFFIGIAPNDDNTNDSIDECTKYTYTYCGNGRLYFNNDEIKTIDDCEEGNILELILFESTLNMKLNGKEQIVLFDDVRKTKYRFAVSLCYAGDECVILEQNIGDPEPEPIEIGQSEKEKETEQINENNDMNENETANETNEEQKAKAEEQTAMIEAEEAILQKNEDDDNDKNEKNETANAQSNSCCCVIL